MPVVWTSHISCFSCGKEFIINRVTVADANAAVAVMPCPYCKAVPNSAQPHRVNYLQNVNLPYRRKSGCQVWHCSQ